MENYFEYLSWCYCKQIYFYAFSAGCNNGFCRIVKWVKNEKHEGQKQFPVAEAGNKILELYRQVYLQNNNNQIISL